MMIRLTALSLFLLMAVSGRSVLAAPCVAGATTGGESRADRERSSSDRIWTLHPSLETAGVSLRFGRQPRSFAVAAVDSAELRSALSRAPLEAVTPSGPHILEADQQPKPILTLPMPDGTFTRVAIEQSPILSPEMQARYPEIRTYRGQGVDDRTITARLDLTPLGFHALLLTGRDAVFVDPADQPDLYISYWHYDLEGAAFTCYTRPEGDGRRIPAVSAPSHFAVLPQANPVGAQLRTYRLAISATGEYGAFFSEFGALFGVVSANAQVATTVNRVTGIYERDLSIRFTLVATRVFTDKNTDPFTGNDIDIGEGRLMSEYDIDRLMSENQTELDRSVGEANYDIGLVFARGRLPGRRIGGKAEIHSTCANGWKARGATVDTVPSGDSFDVDIVAHEIGHQMGAEHTFDGTSHSNCRDNRAGGSAYEPGSGTTIMSYAGGCGEEDIAFRRDPFFHTRSFDEITAYTSGGGACGTLTATGNHPPIPNAGPDFTIPPSTPFTLTGSGSDVDGDSLTYTWEQFDLGPGIGQPTPTYSGPLFRWYPPTSSPSRTIPPMAALIDGTPTPWEVLPTIFRDLNFRLTVRDNRGGSDYDAATIHVFGTPFIVSVPAGPLQCGATATLNWTGGDGDALRALMSTDNGQSFPTTLLASTPDDLAETFTVPRILSNQAWIKLQPIHNIYFSLKGPLSVVDTIAPTVTAPASVAGIECTQCSPRGAPLRGGFQPPPRATDLCDLSPVISHDAPEIFPLGNTRVTWSARDASNNVGTALQFVEVVDTTPPSIQAPENVVAECTGSSGTPVVLFTPNASDTCWCFRLTFGNNAPAAFPLGTTAVTWTFTDGSGNSSTMTQNVRIQDTTSPTLDVEVRPDVLWPPNHKMVRIQARIRTTDICDDTPTIRLLSISTDDQDKGGAAEDIDANIGTDAREFYLRAEHSGGSNGRIYTITYESRDHSGNVTVKQVFVTVPRDQS